MRERSANLVTAETGLVGGIAVNRSIRSFALCPGLVISAALWMHAAPPIKNAKISRDLGSSLPTENVRVIIQYRNDPGPNEEEAINRKGGSVQFAMHSIHAHVVTLNRAAIEELASDSKVIYVSPDRKLAARETSAGAVIPTQTGANFTNEPINVPQVWAQGYDGSGIVVAVIDSGIQDDPDLHPALNWQQPQLHFSGSLPTVLQEGNKGAGRVIWQQNFVADQNGKVGEDPNDRYGHGTHVAGLIGGNGSQSTGSQFFRTFKGAAPNVSLVNLRVLDQNGAGTDSQVIAAIEQAIALKTYFNIRVINLSLGRPIWESYKLDPLCQAVEQAWKAGIVVVVAAGNDGRDLNLNPEGYGTVEAPGNDPYVITVGAMNTMQTKGISDDIIASYSSKGPTFIDTVAKPDIVAPGNLVTSLEFGGDPLAQNNPSFNTPNGFYSTKGNPTQASNQYFPLSGTSMASAVASGAVALLLQAEPGLTPDQVKAVLMRNADNTNFPETSSVTDLSSGIVYKANYDPFTVGSGYLDIAAALNDVMSGTNIPAGTAMSPIANYNQVSGAVTLVADQTSLWLSTPQWSASQIYGPNAFVGGSTALWGKTGLWSRSDSEGFTALWGKDSPWAAATPNAATALWGKTDADGQSADWAADANVTYPY